MGVSREAVRGGVLRILQKHAQAGATVSDKSRLVADLGIDSLGVMEIVADLEDEFELRIQDDALRDIDSVADIARAVETRLRAAGRLEG
jgi:acyl carrier protein